MSKKYNTLVLTSEEFEGNSIYAELANVIRVLTKAGYVCVVSEEETGIYRIDYNYDSYNGFGNAIPEWFDEEELEIIDFCLSYYTDCSCNCGKCK